MNPAKAANKTDKRKHSKKGLDNQILVTKDDRVRRKIIKLSSEGYHYVAAPPGCGKTELLTQRVIEKAARIEADSPAAKRMLCVTFTRNAAEEMQNRVESALKVQNEDVVNSIRDIHSFAVMKLGELQHGKTIGRDILLPERNGDILHQILLDNDITTLKASGQTVKKRRRNSQRAFAFNEEQKEFIFRFSNLCLLLSKVGLGDNSFLELIEDPRSYSWKGTAYSTLQARLRALEKSIIRYSKSQASGRRKEPGIGDYILSVYNRAVADLDYIRKELIDKNNRKKGAIITSFIPFIANKLCEEKRHVHYMDYEDALILLYFELKENTSNKDALKDKFDWVEVDECQDTSLLQLLVIDEVTDKDNACVVYFGDEEQNIYSSITDTTLAMRFIHAKVSKKHENYLRGNFRSEKAILEFIRQYQETYFPEGSGKEDRSPICRNLTQGYDNVKDAVKVIKSRNNFRQYDDMISAIISSKDQGQTAVLFRRNDDVDNFYDVITKLHIQGLGDIKEDDVCIVTKENSLFHMDEFRPIKAILHAAAGLFYEKWWNDLQVQTEKGTTVSADDELLLRYRISPHTLLDKSRRYSYLVEYSLALKKKWEIDLRNNQNRKNSLTPVLLFSFDYVKEQVTLTKYDIKLKAKIGWHKRDLLKVPVDFVPSGSTLTVAFSDFSSKQRSIRRFIGDRICMTVHTPHHMSQMRKYPEAYDLLFSQQVWDIKRLHDELHRSNRLAYTATVAADVYNYVIHLDSENQDIEHQLLKESGFHENLHTAQMAMVKNNSAYNEYRNAVEAKYGETYAKIIALFSEKDNIDSEEESFDLQNEDAGYLLVRAIKIIFNSLQSDEKEKYSIYIKGLIRYLNGIIREQIDKHPLLENDLYNQIFKLRRALFRCTISKLISSNNIKSGIIAMTVHKSKGLNFSNVIVADAITGLYPLVRNHSNAKGSEISSAERSGLSIPQEDINLLYVAITRAIHSIRFFWYPVRYSDSGQRFFCKRTPLLSFFRNKSSRKKK